MQTENVLICTNGMCGECYRCRLNALNYENAELWRDIYQYQRRLARALDKLEECTETLRRIIPPMEVSISKDGNHFGVAAWDGKSLSACLPDLSEEVELPLSIALATAIEGGESEAEIVAPDGCTYSAVLMEYIDDGY